MVSAGVHKEFALERRDIEMGGGDMFIKWER